MLSVQGPQEAPGIAQPTANDERPWVERSRQVRQAEPQPMPHFFQELPRSGVSGFCPLRHGNPVMFSAEPPAALSNS